MSANVIDFDVSLGETVPDLSMDAGLLNGDWCCFPHDIQEAYPLTVLERPPIETYHNLSLSDQDTWRHERLLTEVVTQPEVQWVTDRLLAVGDKNTWNHCNRVGSLMVAAAIKLDMSDSETRLAGRIGVTHDSGKAEPTIQAAIHSPTLMNSRLFEVIQYHVWHGTLTTRKAGLNANVQQGVGNHHGMQTERVPYGVFDPATIRAVPEADGKLPDLKNLLGLVACCDVFDALTAERAKGARRYQASSTEIYDTALVTRVISSIDADHAVKEAVLSFL